MSNLIPRTQSAVFLWSALQSQQSFFASAPTLIALLVDFFLNVGALLFAFTLYAQAPLLLNVLLAVPASFLLLPIVSSNYSSSRGGRSKPAKDATANGHVSPSSSKTSTTASHRPFLTHYRGYMMVSTCVAILAVDFPIFPRRFAKTENWGTSLMDLGVGSFVFSAGVISARSLSKDLSDRRTSLLQRLVVSIRKTLPLIALGLIRLWSVKGLDYAEHVTEYGVHWNFFFTLAMLPPFMELADTLTGLMPLPRIMTYDILYIIICLTYEMVLASTKLKSYILISPRGPDWLSKNREGVFSFSGYLAIFLSGRGIGASLFSRDSSRSKTAKSVPSSGNRGSGPSAQSKKPPSIQAQLAIKFIVSSVTCLVLTDVHGFGLRPSRRLANSPYVTWVSAFNIGQICLFYLVERFGIWSTEGHRSHTTQAQQQHVRVLPLERRRPHVKDSLRFQPTWLACVPDSKSVDGGCEPDDSDSGCERQHSHAGADIVRRYRDRRCAWSGLHRNTFRLEIKSIRTGI